MRQIAPLTLFLYRGFAKAKSEYRIKTEFIYIFTAYTDSPGAVKNVVTLYVKTCNNLIVFEANLRSAIAHKLILNAKLFRLAKEAI